MRLTVRTSSGTWKLKGVTRRQMDTGEKITGEVHQKLYRALWKLAEYEDTGLSPNEMKNLIFLVRNQSMQLLAKLQESRERIQEAKELHKWIPVENGGEMPEKNEWVLATVKRHFWIYEGEEHPEAIYTTLATYDGMWRFLDTESDNADPCVSDADDCNEENPNYPMAEVIAWMELPEPIKNPIK